MTPKDDIIQIPVTAGTKAILNRAATLRGQSLSEFILDSARRCAEQTILDQRVFLLDDASHKAFLAFLDAPPKPTAALRKLMARQSKRTRP